MWVITPDAAHNTDKMETIWTAGGDDRTLHFRYPGREDGITFLNPLSAVRAFDAVVNGMAEGRANVFLQEFRPSGMGIPVLKAEYDRDDWETPVEEAYSDFVRLDMDTLTRKGFMSIVKND